MKFEKRKSEIIKGHEIVKTPREHWFKIKIYVESNDGFLFNSDKNKGMWFDEKNQKPSLIAKESYIYSNNIGKKPIIFEVLLVCNCD